LQEKDSDGNNVWPLMRGDAGARNPQRHYFISTGWDLEAVMTSDGDWKILRNDPFSPYELYHLGKDPREANNLAVTNRKKFKELAGAIRHHIQRGGITPWQPSSD
jgi:hypothetical protein